MWLFYYFYFERNYDDLKSKSPCFLLNKIINFNKNETELKMENPITVLERWTMCFSSYKNCKLKIKLWWVEAHKRKKNKLYKNKVYFVHRTYFQHLGFISIYSVFNKLSEYIYILRHMKEHYSIHFCCLFLKSLKAFSVSLPSF